MVSSTFAAVSLLPRVVQSGAIRDMLSALSRDRRSASQVDFHNALAMILYNTLDDQTVRQQVLDFTFEAEPARAAAALRSSGPLAQDSTGWARWLGEIVLCDGL